MFTEKRSEERLVIPGDVMVDAGDILIQCSIENISYYGAYLKVNNGHSNYRFDLGKNVKFSVKAKQISESVLTGQILRQIVEGENTYIAVYFMKPVTFN